jgi:tungstate transport system ATP-binding protein
MTEPAYRLRDLVKAYDNREVLNVRDMDIHRGEIFSVVGPSGSGKSTLLRLLNFLELPSAGSIQFGNYTTNGTGTPPLNLRRKVTTVFQRPVLLNTTVYNNVAYGLQIRGHGKDRERIEEALERVGLMQLAGQRARTLSGGEAQRVALARAIVIEPEVLLLDEPTANLDPYNVGLIEEIARELNQQQNTTIVLVTHNVFQAKRLADRIALFLDGQVIEVAPTQQFFSNPKDPRAEAFVQGDIIY